jgi:hypothetical protein
MSSEGNGFFGSLTDSLSNLGSSVTEGVSSLKDKFKTNGSNGNAAAITTPVDNTAMGGKKKRSRRTKRRMRGGYSDNISRTGVASSAASISDIKTPTPRFVGGRSRRRSNRKSRKSRKSRK